MLKIYYCKSDELLPFWQQGIELVTESRKLKVKRLLNENDRMLSIGAGLLLRSVLKITSDDMLGYNEHGKPLFNEHGYFSISHSGNVTVLTVSENDVGADIEMLRKPNERLLLRCFSAEEIDFVKDSSEKYTRIWTEKEAVLKLLGTGLSISPGSFSLVPIKNEYELFGKKIKILRTEIDKMPFSIAFCEKDFEFEIKKLSVEELLES